MSGPAFANNRFLPRAQPATGGPAPGGDSLVAVPNIAALVALDDTAVDDGGVVSVKSVLDLWMLDKTDVTTPIDGITSVLPNSGVGRWNRMKLPALFWQLQTTWYIDEITGGDENGGATALSALATWDEYQRRIGEGPLEVSHVVNFSSTLVQDIHVNTTSIDENVTITLQGVRSSAIYSGSVTAKQAQNAATNTDLQITDAALPVSWTASGLVDKLYVLTSGPNAGAAGWVVLDVGAKTARITKAYNEGAGTFVEPGVGETFDVVDQGLVEGELRGIEGGNVNVRVRDLRFLDPGLTVFSTKGGTWIFFFSDLEGGVVNMSGASEQSSFFGAVSTYATRLQATSFILNERSTWNWYATYLASGVTMRSSGVVLVGADSIMQYKGVGANYGVRCNGQSRFNLRAAATFGVFDFTTNPGQRALRMTTGGTCNLQNYLWGYGNTFDYAIQVDPHSAVEYTAGFKPVVVAGALNDTLIGGLARAYVVLPMTNLSKLCGIIQT
jgi:hypothetical protein